MGAGLPPGQVWVRNWPVLHAGTVPADLTSQNWTLNVYGAVAAPTTFSYADLLALPQVEIECDIHCVTSWSKTGLHWKGVAFRTIRDIVRPDGNVRFVVMECEQGFTTSLPIEALLDPDVLMAHTVESGPLPPEHGGPVRMLVPKRYFYKSAKWLRGLKLVHDDEPGFWEVRGYSNIADPWAQTRYSADDVRVIQRMRRANLFRPISSRNGESPDAQPA
jgi:DMSO/TMAO reductase YedYZ molybdopterin-dependent catalytic subunit